MPRWCIRLSAWLLFLWCACSSGCSDTISAPGYSPPARVCAADQEVTGTNSNPVYEVRWISLHWCKRGQGTEAALIGQASQALVDQGGIEEHSYEGADSVVLLDGWRYSFWSVAAFEMSSASSIGPRLLAKLSISGAVVLRISSAEV